MTPTFWRDPHIVRTGKSLLKALFISTGIFLFLFVLLKIGGSLYVSFIATKSSDAFHAGIAQDLAYLKEQGDAVSKDELLHKYLIDEDSEKLVEFTSHEVSSRGIGLMGVTNSEGVLISRTKTRGYLGTNSLLATSHGRAVDREGVVESIEISGFNPSQLLMTTGRRILQDDRMIGVLFANHLMDDAYATHFRDGFLPDGVEVIFYTKEFGVYGNSFSDLETRKRLNSYFNSGSEWIRNGNSGRTISLSDGTFYLVENIIFPGVEESPGGALLFIPRHDDSGVADIIIAFLTLSSFVCFALRSHLRSRGEECGWRYGALLVLIAIPVFTLVITVLRLEKMGYLELESIPFTLYNSTIRLQPDFGIYDVDFEQRFSIIVDTGDEAINTVQIRLIFDPEMVEVKALETASSTCSFVIENTIDTSLGRADLACVVFKPGGESGSLPIADVVLVPRRTGTFTLSFDTEESMVNASDGLGTNVLRMAQSGSYRVDVFDPNSTTTARSFVVFSTTHPNQSRWYNSRTARFVWRGKPGEVYAYAFDNSPDTIPSKKKTTYDTEVSIPIPGDGIFYFHLQLSSGGPIAHYRLQVDTTPPSILSLHLSEDRIVAGDVVRFMFEADDIGSGIQKNYYVDLGNRLFLPIGNELFVPFLDEGDHEVVLRVYDDAGNYAEKSQAIRVDAR